MSFYGAYPIESRAIAEWVVRSDSRSEVELVAEATKAGRITLTLPLGTE